MDKARASRRLAAILAADMVGYSRLMGLDEVGTISRLRESLDDVFNPKIEEYGGRVVKLMGDGILVEFASAVDAVLCAIDVQNAINERASSSPSDERIAYRIGVNLGDIVIDGEDILGDGVNIAARLEGLAEPGGICISGKVHDEVSDKLDLTFLEIGEQQVKNIARPVRAYFIDLQDRPSMPVAENRNNTQPAVAVLPFDNLSQDPEQQYFSDGLSEDIITLLSAWRSFPVIARNSSFAYRGQSRDVREIARELSARYIIEGSVRKSGNRVRVTSQLSDAESGHHLWADKFDGSLDDIFQIQDDITRQIVTLVEPEMEKAERNKAETERSSNLSAWDYYLRARALSHLLTPDDNKRARELYQKAIELDANYGDAYAGLSLTYQREMLFDFAGDRANLEQDSLSTARKAVDLDDSSALAHLALGGAYIWLNQHELSIAATRTATELNPSNVQARFALGNRLDIVGSPTEGIPLLESSLELNPRDPHAHIYFVQLARAYVNARDYDKAMGYLRESIRRKPDHPHTYHVLAICLGHLDRVEEACEAARQCDALHPGFMEKRTHWNIYVDPASNEHLTEGLRKAGLVQ